MLPRADKTGHYEIALDRFCHYLAIVETDPSTTMVSEMRATLTSNVGACLHNLGLVDEAVQYYERALQEFKAMPFSIFSRLQGCWGPPETEIELHLQRVLPMTDFF